MNRKAEAPAALKGLLQVDLVLHQLVHVETHYRPKGSASETAWRRVNAASYLGRMMGESDPTNSRLYGNTGMKPGFSILPEDGQQHAHVAVEGDVVANGDRVKHITRNSGAAHVEEDKWEDMFKGAPMEVRRVVVPDGMDGTVLQIPEREMSLFTEDLAVNPDAMPL